MKGTKQNKKKAKKNSSKDNTERDPFKRVKVKHGRGRIGKSKTGKVDFEWWKHGKEGEDDVDWGDWSYCGVVRFEDFRKRLLELNGYEVDAVQYFLNKLSDLEKGLLYVENPSPEEEKGKFVDEFYAYALAVEYGFRVDHWTLHTIAEEGKERIEAGEREKRRREKQGNKNAKSLDADLDNLKEVCRLIDKELAKAKEKQTAKAKQGRADKVEPTPTTETDPLPPEPKAKKKREDKFTRADPDGKIQDAIRKAKKRGIRKNLVPFCEYVYKAIKGTEGSFSRSEDYEKQSGHALSTIKAMTRKIYSD